MAINLWVSLTSVRPLVPSLWMAVMSCHYSPLTSSTPTVDVDKHIIIGPKVRQTNMQTSASRVCVALWKRLEDSVMLLASTQEPQQITKSVVYSINLQEDQKMSKIFSWIDALLLGLVCIREWKQTDKQRTLPFSERLVKEHNENLSCTVWNTRTNPRSTMQV